MSLFDVDNWTEVAATLRKHKLRTTLTGLGVFIGIVILLIMLGGGLSLERGVKRNMVGFATNSVFVWGQRTAFAYDGLPENRQIVYNNADIEALRAIPGIAHVAPRNQRGGFMGGSNVRYGTKTGSFQVAGDYPAFQYVQTPLMRAGRFINDADIAERRKIAVIGEGVVEQLYEGKDPIGTYIEANGVYFQVVGVFGSRARGEQRDRVLNTIHVPFTTFQQAFNFGDFVSWFAIVAEPWASASAVEENVRVVLADRHRIAPWDREAIGSWNAGEQFGKMNMLFFVINLVMSWAGGMTLLAGVIGVSNIMLISVRERTKEIGVRKALGATPSTIVRMVVSESAVLTTVFGFLGVVGGIAILELATWALAKHLPDGPFGPAQVEMSTALIIAVVLAVAGVLAGVIPAYHAAKIPPVEALRTE
jgi:putative ABC transport system permease protein